MSRSPSTTTTQKPKRRWVAFSLRTAGIAFTALALWMGWYSNRAWQQRRAVETILRKGGRVCYVFNDPVRDPTAVTAPKPALADYLGLDFVDTVTIAEFLGKDFTDDDLALLDDLPHVHWLRFYDTSITGSGFRHVSARTKVNVLLVNLSPLENAALMEIGRMSQLKTLHITEGASITDDGLASLAPLRHLESLSLSQCTISNAGLARLDPPATLREVSLEDTQIGDAGVALLARLPNLERLSLVGSPVTDASTAHFAAMPSLKSVMLGNTRVSDQALRALQAKAGPSLYVAPDPDRR
jgi:hypothetical protein